MAVTYKVLGQSAPSATTNTSLYVVPSSTSTIISTLTVCNRDTSAGTFRIAIRPAGATIANSHYIVYDSSIAANDTVTFTLGITLATTDVITVYASSANMTFNAFGSELT
jgi:hypothetical protein